ncbi:YceI family protein [Roseibium salinum]|uniref:YceI family protein n=1 Tax=Roseibium salinum TaxID=1604349 RepID=A0ABT3QZJ2_9HYPH|nr:YceI family protein [Roseibium sp. DSM 29163]MCX2722258.1 YceI family protein [Roseibium sp. DSM 29163]
MLKFRSTLADIARRAAQSLAMLACIATLSLAPAEAGSLSGTYVLAPADIDTGFSVKVLGRGPVTGQFQKVSGTMILNQNRPEKSRVTVDVDLRSIETGSDRITDFLKSSAMFNVAKHPIARFESTSVRITGENSAEVEGVLTMRGQKKRTRLSVTVNGETSSSRVDFQVSGGFFRSLYGMEAGLPIYADKVNLKINGTGRRS